MTVNLFHPTWKWRQRCEGDTRNFYVVLSILCGCGCQVEADWTERAAVESAALDDELCAKRPEGSSANPACESCQTDA